VTFHSFKNVIFVLVFCACQHFAFTAQAAELAGGLSGTFQHTAGGQARYQVKIETPPGRMGLDPSISLNYSSSATNALLGVGWNLSAGTSRIDRVGQTFDLDGQRTAIALPEDGNFNTDRLALDGNRLMLISGNYGADDSVYQTRLETGRKVVAVDHNPELPGPEEFLVYTSMGQVMRYGGYVHHRIQAAWNKPVLSWLLTSVTDADGHQIHYDYYACPANEICPDGAGREYIPKSIFYEGRTINFIYEERPDQTRYFSAGLQMGRSQRLVGIEVYVNQDGDANYTEPEDFAYEYRLTYASDTDPQFNNYSKLTSVQQFDKDGNSLAPVTFEWLGGNEQVGFVDYALYANHSSPMPSFAKVKTWANHSYSGKYNEGTHMVDLNGDGLKDLIQGVYWGEPSNGTPSITRRILLNNRTGWTELPASHPYMADWAAMGSSLLFSVRSQVDGTHPGGNLGTRLADLNGDGLPDMIQLTDGNDPDDQTGLSKPATAPKILINQGEAGGWQALPASHPLLANLPKAANGDSAIYFAKIRREQVYHFGSIGGGTQLSDLNGDGLPDLFQWVRISGGHQYRVLLNKGTDAVNGGWQSVNLYRDSVQALLDHPNWNTRSGFAEALNNNGNFGSWRSDLGMRLRDIDGNGLPDLILYNEGRGSYPTIAQVALNRGQQTGFVYDAAFSNSLPTNDANAPFFTRCIPDSNQVKQRGTRLFDLNGDGLPDLLRLYKDGAGVIQRQLLMNNGKGFQLVSDWTMPGDDVFLGYQEGDFVRDGGVRLADINNDQLIDMIVLFYDTGGNHRRQIYLQEHSPTRKGWYVAAQSSSARDWFSGLPDDLYFVGRDGGSSFDMGTRIDDVNGDQRLDFIQLAHIDEINTYRRFLLGNYAVQTSITGETVYQTAVQRIRRVNEGLGGILEFEYNPLSLGAPFYTRGGNAAYPYRNVTPARHVLYASYAHQPLGGLATQQTLTKHYRYNNYQIQLDVPTANGQPGFDGGGSLGFASVEMIADDEGIATKTSYIQDRFLVNGRTAHVINCTTDEEPIVFGEAFFEYEVRTDFPGALGKTYRVHRTATEQKHYEDNQVVYTTRFTKNYDAYGNAVLESRLGDVTTEVDDIFFHQTYNNRLEQWRFGLPEMKTISTSANYHHVSARQHVTDYDYTADWKLRRTKILQLDDGPDHITTYAYDDFGNVESITDASGLVTRFEYDTVFNQFATAIIKDPTGFNHRTEFITDPVFGNRLEMTGLNGNRFKTTYDGFGRLHRVYTEKPDSTELKLLKQDNYYWATADGRGLRIKSIQAADWDTNLGLDYMGTNTWQDTWGRTYRIRRQGTRNAIHSNVFTTFNQAGRIGAVSVPSEGGPAHWVRYTYDERGRQIETEYPRANANDPIEVELYDYSFEQLNGRAHTMMIHYGRHARGGQPHKVTKTLSDARQRIMERRFVEDGGHESRMFYQYDALDRVIEAYSQENAHSERVRFRLDFDSLNHKQWSREEVVKADGQGGWQVLESKAFNYTHDMMGRMLSSTDPNGNLVEVTYDSLGRKTLESLNPADPASDGDLAFVRYVHDQGDGYPIGNVNSIVGEDINQNVLFQYDFTHDKLGKIVRQQTTFNPGGTWEQTFSYRPDGLPEVDNLADGSTFSRTYTGLGWPASVTLDEPDHPARVHIEWQDHNAAGSPGRVVYGNGVVTEYTHEPHNMRMSAMTTFDSGDQTIADLSYFWNINGQIEEILDHANPNQDQYFEYDRLNRLKFAQGVYGNKNYSYDSAGNMLEKGDKVFEDFTGFRLDSGFNAATGQTYDYNYDANGNQVARNVSGVDEFFEFDPYDRIVNYFRQDSLGNVIRNSYRYDHTGRRYMKEDSDGGITWYVSSGLEVFRKGNLEQQTKYVFGSGGKMAQVTSLSAPDLQVTIRGTEVLDYNRYRLELKVTNIGDRVTDSDCLLVLRTDLDYAERTVPQIGPGGHERFFIEVDATAKGTAIAVVDADFVITEKDEANNAYNLQIPIGPDLAFASTSLVAVSATEAELTVVVENKGQGPAPANLLMIRGSGYEESLLMGRLEANGSVTFTRNINIPADGSRISDFDLRIDPKNEVIEIKENNNQRNLPLYIPDYEVRDFRLLAGDLFGHIGYEISVTNLAQGGPQQVDLQIYNPKTKEVFMVQVSLGKPGNSVLVKGSLPGSFASSFLATVNPDRVLYESDFTNNEVSSSSIIGTDTSKKHAGD
jgi:YD repeat-containing protein